MHQNIIVQIFSIVDDIAYVRFPTLMTRNGPLMSADLSFGNVCCALSSSNIPRI